MIDNGMAGMELTSIMLHCLAGQLGHWCRKALEYAALICTKLGSWHQASVICPEGEQRRLAG